MKQLKQRNLILSLIMMLVMAMCPGAAQAQAGDFETGGYWDLEDGVLTITGIIPDYTQGEGHYPDWRAFAEYVQKVVFKDATVTTFCGFFAGMSNLTSIEGLENLNTYNVTNMSSMFEGCSSLTSLDLSSLNTWNVRDMSSMFEGCSSLTSLDLSSFNTANVDAMAKMFYGCSSLTSLDISSFNTRYAQYFNSMFGNCENLTILKIGKFEINSLLNDEGIHTEVYSYDDIFNNVPLKMVIATENKVPTLPDAIFPEGVEVIVPSDALEAYKIADYWELYKLTANDFPETFKLCGTCGWSVANCELDIFPLNGEEGTLADWTSTREGLPSRPSWYGREDVNNVNIIGTVNAKTCVSFFDCLTHLNTIAGLEKLKTDNVTNMNSMFRGCSSLSSLDLTSLNTSNVTDMSFMFSDCNLEELILDNFDMQKVTDYENMFDNAPAKILFKSCPYLKDGTFNSLDSKICLALDDKSVISNDANNFPLITGGASYTRSMKNTWGTLVLPFDIDYDCYNGNYSLYYLWEAGENNIKIVSYPSVTIPAGTPLIVRKENGDGIILESAEEHNFSTDIKTQSGDGWTMSGTYSALTGQTGMYYITSDKFYHASSPITIAAFRAWLSITGADAKTLTINIMNADGSTGIETIDADSLSLGKGMGEVFNLNGQRLSAPQKGINIINGKKINFVR